MSGGRTQTAAPKVLVDVDILFPILLSARALENLIRVNPDRYRK